MYLKLLSCLIILIGWQFSFSSNWNIQLLVYEDNCNDLYSFLGEDSLALDELDNLDMVNWNPGITPWVDCYFPHPEWSSGAGNYAADIRSNSLTEKNWFVTISSSTSSNHTCNIEVQNIQNLPEYYNFFLQYTDTIVNLRDTATFSLQVNANINLEIFTLFRPFIAVPLDSISIYQNIIYEINLNETFSFYGSESVVFSYLTNPDLVQIINDSLYTISPADDWTGTTTASLVASIPDYSVTMEFAVNAFHHFYGDIDFNDEIEAYDASLVLQHIVQIIELSEESQLRADVDGNAEIDAFDAALILRYTVGYLEEFPILNRNKKNK